MLSSTRLFNAERSTVSHNLYRLSKCFPALRVLMIASTAPEPTFLIAPKPNRILSPSGVKFSSDLFTSGGNTLMPISLHSLIYFTTFAVFPVSEVSKALIKSIG